MLQGAGNFVRRHKRKIIVATGLVAGGYFVIDFVKNKFFELQDRFASEQAARENLKRRFEQNQEDATFTIMALLPSLATQVVDKYPVEKITQELQAKRSEKLAAVAADIVAATAGTTGGPLLENSGATELNDSVHTLPTDSSVVSLPTSDAPSESWSVSDESTKRKTKTELWRDLKIRSIARAFTLIYSSALLVFFTRLQLNILGRKNYVASVIHMAESKQKSGKHYHGSFNDDDTYDDSRSESDKIFPPTEEDLAKLVLEEEELNINRMYLTFSWWLLNKGWIALSERVEDAVIQVFDSINPRTDLTLAELSDLIGQVQYRVDHPVSVVEVNNFINNLLPPGELESYVLSQAPVNHQQPQSSGPSVQTEDDSVTSGPLRRLLDETSDFIESPNAVEVIQRLVHSGLTVFVDKISGIYPSAGVDGEPSKVKLASILANVTRQSHAMTSGKPFEPNEYIQSMIDVPELDGFSALVYSNFGTANE